MWTINLIVCSIKSVIQVILFGICFHFSRISYISLMVIIVIVWLGGLSRKTEIDGGRLIDRRIVNQVFDLSRIYERQIKLVLLSVFVLSIALEIQTPINMGKFWALFLTEYSFRVFSTDAGPYFSRLMRLWYLSHRRPAKAQVSLCIRAASTQPLLFAHMKYGSRWRVWPKIRHLVPLDECACAFEEWVYGGWKVP